MLHAKKTSSQEEADRLKAQESERKKKKNISEICFNSSVRGQVVGKDTEAQWEKLSFLCAHMSAE